MKHLFYFIGIVPILWELICVLDTKKVHKFHLKLKAKKYDEMDSSQKAITFLMLFYVLWILVGLFSSQWIIFTFYFILGIIPKNKIWHRKFDGILSVLMLVFIILNVYHFHIDIWSILIK